jgi:hypothetical protein
MGWIDWSDAVECDEWAGEAVVISNVGADIVLVVVSAAV